MLLALLWWCRHWSSIVRTKLDFVYIFRLFASARFCYYLFFGGNVVVRPEMTFFVGCVLFRQTVVMLYSYLLFFLRCLVLPEGSPVKPLVSLWCCHPALGLFSITIWLVILWVGILPIFLICLRPWQSIRDDLIPSQFCIFDYDVGTWAYEFFCFAVWKYHISVALFWLLL